MRRSSPTRWASPSSSVEIARADTGLVPDSGPTVASRTTMVVGGLLKRCADEMRERWGRLVARRIPRRAHGPLVVTSSTSRRRDWPGTTRRIAVAYGSFGWGCDVVEVELDPVTYEVRPTRRHGRRRTSARPSTRSRAGQIEGGTAQALGYALLEEVVMRDGAMANAQLTNYIIPTTLDTPPMDVVFSSGRTRTGRRRKGHRRDADRRRGPGRGQRHPQPGHRHSPGARYAGAGDGALGRMRRRSRHDAETARSRLC